MSVKLSLLQLDTYFLKEISYFLKGNLETIPEKITKTIPIKLGIKDITTPLNTENKEWRCELIIESADEGTELYKFKIVMVGFFKVHPNMTSQDAKILAESNCPAVLYSTAREIIATVTRRSPYPATLLPLVTFVKNLDNLEKPKLTKKVATKKVH